MLLTRIQIDGLWGSVAFDKKIDENYNFIIGKNGTGKTTIINLVAAALTADFERLDKIDFDLIKLTLKEQGKKSSCSVIVKKIQKEGLPYFDISYQIKLPGSKEAIIFDLDKLAEERHFRGLPPRMVREQRLRNRRYVDLDRQLNQIAKVCWLSVNRATVDYRNDPRADERVQTSPVDQKLESMSNRLVRLFSQINARIAVETSQFQKNSFLNLLEIGTHKELEKAVSSLKPESEKEAVQKALIEFGVGYEASKRTTEELYELFVPAREKFLGKGGISLQELFSLSAALRAKALVQNHFKLQEQKQALFKIKDAFLTVVNDLFQPRKKISISDRNELQVNLPDGRPISIFELSSGEKQLLIILGEALLQEEAAAIYIADEPELSLHVEWQEKLVPSIKRVNPLAQIIFATHSPDIVGVFQDKIFDMEVLP
ncbi:MAG: AAA family ATPase [Gallionellaceae bacterium]|nr:AAA family ATPase [Gallionellaceae bacterium]